MKTPLTDRIHARQPVRPPESPRLPEWRRRREEAIAEDKDPAARWLARRDTTALP